MVTGVGQPAVPEKKGDNRRGEAHDKCEACLKGKASAVPVPGASSSRTTQPLQLIHSDVCGPLPEASWGGARYLVTFTDDFSRKTFGYLMKNKSQSNKPIMEKRRRARINNCLNELKALILDAMKKDPARHSKLEKADILEMTVKHLEGLRTEGAASPDRFRAGYKHCLSEVARFPGLETGLRKRLVKHLEGCVVPGTRPPGAPTPPSDTEDSTAAIPHSTILISAGPGSGVRLVPTRLSNGDIALVLPAGVSANALGAVPTLVPLSPRDVASSTSSEARCFSPASSGWGSPPPPADDSAPLALVTRKTPEEKPWRPW